MLQIDRLFYRGAYADILAATVESTDSRWSKDHSHYVVGALAFSGRIDDALVLLKKFKTGMTPAAHAAAHFFAGIGLVRVSRYQEGAHLLAGNLQRLRRRTRAHVGLVETFYAHQGLAFFRYFQCRYARAVTAAKLAWEAALEADYFYGQSLASDLRGHALVRSGAITEGLRALDDAQRLSDRFELGGQANVIETARFYYKATNGLFGKETIPELTKFVGRFSPEDNFTLAAAQTALAHALSLRGKIRESEVYLAEAARVILKAGHRRHKAMVLHKLAHNRYYQSRFEAAKEFLERAEREIDQRFDLDYALQITGLRLKICRKAGDAAGQQALEREVLRLTRLVGSGIGKNILWRDFGVGSPTLKGDDSLGDLRHLARQGLQTPYADVVTLIDEGHFGFLHDVVPAGNSGRAVCFDLLPQKLALLDDGDFVLSEEPISSTLKAIALNISRAPATKEQLISTHWGFDYNPMRHDTLVYASINRLRKALGESASNWLTYADGAYSWIPGVKVFTYEPQGISQLAMRRTATVDHGDHGNQAGVADEADDLAGDHALNHRQLVLLSELMRREALDVQDCVRLFGISRITAFRDLGQLVKLGLVRKTGKGRATAYQRMKTQNQPL